MSDVVVIGGGIVGVATAWALAEAGADVVVVERSGIAAEASGLNAGVVGRWTFTEPGSGSSPDTEPGTGGIAFYRHLVEACGHDIGLRERGGLSVTRTDDDFAWAKGLELVNAELLDGDAAREIEPALAPEVAGAIWAPDSVSAEPDTAVKAAAVEAERAGTRFEIGRPVTGLTSTIGGFRVELSGGAATLDCERVAITSGPWSGDIAQLLDPAIELPVCAVLGQMWATAPVPSSFGPAISSMESLRYWNTSPATDPPNVTHVGDRRVTRHLYGRQRPNGEIVFGGDRRVLAGERRVDDDGIAVNFAQAAEILPVLRGLQPVRTWAGIMPWTTDGEPIFGPLDGHDGVFVASGLASSGFTRGPVTGRRLADVILG